MNRRRFLNILLASLGSISLASFVYPVFKFLAPPAGETNAKKLTMQKREIPTGEAKDISYNSTPIVIINHATKGFIALSRVCTHLGCLVEYDKANNRLLCPCHAGMYDLEGSVISGPPPKPLPKLPIRVEGENIVIG